MADDLMATVTEEERLAAGRHEQGRKRENHTSFEPEEATPAAKDTTGSNTKAAEGGGDKAAEGGDKIGKAKDADKGTVQKDCQKNASTNRAQTDAKKGNDKGNNAKDKNTDNERKGRQQNQSSSSKREPATGTGKSKAKAAATPKGHAKSKPKARPKQMDPAKQATWTAAASAGDIGKSRLLALKEQQKSLREQAKRAALDEYNERRRRQRVIDRFVGISDADVIELLQIRAEMRKEQEERANAHLEDGMANEGEEEELNEGEESEAAGEAGEEEAADDDAKL